MLFLASCGQTKICELNMATPVEEDVVWFNIAMGEVSIVLDVKQR